MACDMSKLANFSTEKQQLIALGVDHYTGDISNYVAGNVDTSNRSMDDEIRDRFEKELSLAPKEKVLLIENANYSDVANGNYNTQYNKKSFLASLHSFWFKYNIPVFFMPDNKYSALFIKKYFEYYLKNNLR